MILVVLGTLAAQGVDFWEKPCLPGPSYAQTFPGTRFLRGFRNLSDARAMPSFPGTRILRVFRAPNDTRATPRPSPAHVFYMVFVPPTTPELRPDLPWHTHLTWFLCPQQRQSYAQTFPGTHILRGLRPPSDTRDTPRPSPAHVFYVVFVTPAIPELRPDLPRHMYFKWFSYPTDTRVTPRPSPAHVFYVVFVN